MAIHFNHSTKPVINSSPQKLSAVFRLPNTSFLSSGFSLGNTPPDSIRGAIPTAGPWNGKGTQAALVLCHMTGSGMDTGQNMSHSKEDISTTGLLLILRGKGFLSFCWVARAVRCAPGTSGGYNERSLWGVRANTVDSRAETVGDSYLMTLFQHPALTMQEEYRVWSLSPLKGTVQHLPN